MYDFKFTTFTITSSRHISAVRKWAVILHWIVWTACLFRIDFIERRSNSNWLFKTKTSFSFIFVNITLLLVDMMDGISENEAISHKGKDAKNIVWSLKRPLLNTLKKVLSIVQQRNSKMIKKESVNVSKRKRE